MNKDLGRERRFQLELMKHKQDVICSMFFIEVNLNDCCENATLTFLLISYKKGMNTSNKTE